MAATHPSITSSGTSFVTTAGFRSLYPGAKAGEFILLDKTTNGRLGRVVCIQKDVAATFARCINKDQYDGQRLLSQLRQLRATAGSGSAYSNAADAFEHMHIVGNLQIGYKVVDSVVYITRIDFATHEDVRKAGAYVVRYGNKNWAPDRKPVKQLQSQFAAINGLAKGYEHAASNIMPAMVESVYEKECGRDSVKRANFNLFYNPQPLYAQGKTWRSPEQKQTNQAFVVGKLGNLLLDAQSKGQPINWVVHGNGCKLLAQTLKRLQGKNLAHHRVFLAAPTESLSYLLPLIRGAGLTLHDEVMKFHSNDWTSIHNRILGAKAIHRELKAFGGSFIDYADTYLEGAKSDAFGFVSAGLTLGAMSSTVYPVNALGAAKAAFTAKSGSQAMRNMLCNSSLSEKLNPHLNPMMDNHQFNAMVRRAHGSETKTFMAMLTTQRGWA